MGIKKQHTEEHFQWKVLHQMAEEDKPRLFTPCLEEPVEDGDDTYSGEYYDVLFDSPLEALNAKELLSLQYAEKTKDWVLRKRTLKVVLPSTGR